MDCKQFGRTVCALTLLLCILSTSFAASPQRIVSGAPGFTEILYALGVGDRIVGTTNYCDYPSEAQKTVKIGDVLNPNIERIASLKPDLVFCGAWKWNVPEKLRALGLTVVEVKDVERIDQIFERIEMFGNQIGKTNEAAEMIARMKQQIEQMKQHQPAQKHSVYIEIDSGNWTAGSASYLSESLELIGLKNIFGDRKEPYLTVTMESIIARNPDLIISLTRTRKEMEESTMWQSIPAIQKGRILDKEAMDWNMVTRQSQRLIDGMIHLQQLIQNIKFQ